MVHKYPFTDLCFTKMENIGTRNVQEDWPRVVVLLYKLKKLVVIDYLKIEEEHEILINLNLKEE